MKVDYKWIIKIVLITLITSALFTFISETAIPHLNIFFGIILTLVIILIGVLFDMIGVAVTTSKEAPFHAMATKKIKGSKTSLWLIKNADKVSSFCCDVIGDICGIISGSTGAAISLAISNKFNLNLLIVIIIVMSIISALTIGGKACEKSIAINKSESIVKVVADILSVFKREK